MDHFNVISSSLMYHVLWAKHWPLGLSSHDLCNSAQEAKQFLRLEATVEALRVSKYSTTSAIPINHKSYFRWENSSVDWHRLGYFFLKMNTTVQLPKYIAFNPHILCKTNFNECTVGKSPIFQTWKNMLLLAGLELGTSRLLIKLVNEGSRVRIPPRATFFFTS